MFDIILDLFKKKENFLSKFGLIKFIQNYLKENQEKAHFLFFQKVLKNSKKCF